MNSQRPNRARSARRTMPAFSLPEVLVSLVLVSGLLVAALDTVGASAVGQRNTDLRAQGQLLAADLMAEILDKEYEEPEDQPVFGTENLENAGTRATLDDVDDFDGWTAMPPQNEYGTDIPGLTEWTRSVEVVWVNPDDLAMVSVTPTEVKRITVTVIHNDAAMAQRVAIRTPGLPPPVDGVKILFPVGDVENLTQQEHNRNQLMQQWGFTLILIAAAASQETFDVAATATNVAYVSVEVSEIDLDTKLREASIGVVNEDPELTEEFGIVPWVYGTFTSLMNIDDNTHYITSTFDTGLLAFCNSFQPVFVMDVLVAPGAQILSSIIYIDPPLVSYNPALAAIEVGGALSDGGTAAGRRVQLPWGQTSFVINSLNDNGKILMRRAIEWAAGQEVPDGEPSGACGDGICSADENTCTCPDDCGTPPAEGPLFGCTDTLDNDCDGLIDCDDGGCAFHPACRAGAVCGNGICEFGERFNNCPEDCPRRR